MMPDRTRSRAAGTRAAALFSLVLLAVAGVAQAAEADAPAPPDKDTAARLMVAELALERGDCPAAAETYLKLARASADVRIAGRATEVGITCEQLAVARDAAARWRELDPHNGNAALAAAIVALKRYDLAEARAALTAWRDSGQAGNQDPLRFAELLERETESTAAYRVFGEVLARDDPTAEVLLAHARLALHAYDMKRALELARRALALDATLPAAQLVIVRAHAALGQFGDATAPARGLADSLEGEDRFVLADVLTAAERLEAARDELLRLRAVSGLETGADRRLGLLALEHGDEAEAEKRFSAMLGQRNSMGLGVFHLAQLAERRGDAAQALQYYRQLGDSGLALSAAAGSARVMMKLGERRAAMALLDDRLRDHPDEAIEIAGLRANLLAVAGDADGAVAAMDEALRRHPGHPGLSYERATVLERVGRTREALRALEALLRERPDDPGIANALGYTLADHGQSLARAEKLVRQALAVSPDNPAIQDSLGWVLFRRGQPREAVPILEAAWRAGRDPEIAGHFGEVLWKLGDEGRARYVWEQALRADPDNRVVLATRSRLTGEPAPAR